MALPLMQFPSSLGLQVPGWYHPSHCPVPFPISPMVSTVSPVGVLGFAGLSLAFQVSRSLEAAACPSVILLLIRHSFTSAEGL